MQELQRRRVYRTNVIDDQKMLAGAISTFQERTGQTFQVAIRRVAALLSDDLPDDLTRT